MFKMHSETLMVDIPTDRGTEHLEISENSPPKSSTNSLHFPTNSVPLKLNNAEEMVKGKAHTLGKPSRRQRVFRQSVTYVPRAHLSSTPIHLFLSFLLLMGTQL